MFIPCSADLKAAFQISLPVLCMLAEILSTSEIHRTLLVFLLWDLNFLLCVMFIYMFVLHLLLKSKLPRVASIAASAFRSLGSNSPRALHNGLNKQMLSGSVRNLVLL